MALDGEKSAPTDVVPTARAVPRFLTTRYRAPADLVSRSAGGSLSLPRVGISAPVHPVGLDRGTMAIPTDPRRVGWLDRSAAVGDEVGSSVISGHVSSRTDRPGALWRLRDVRVGDRVRWTSAGRTETFEVRRVHRYPRRTGLPADLFRTDGARVLHLVTCARRVRRGGRFHYTDNLVVTARPALRPVPRTLPGPVSSLRRAGAGRWRLPCGGWGACAALWCYLVTPERGTRAAAHPAALSWGRAVTTCSGVDGPGIVTCPGTGRAGPPATVYVAV